MRLLGIKIGKFIFKNLASSPATASYKAQWAPSTLLEDKEGTESSQMVHVSSKKIVECASL